MADGKRRRVEPAAARPAESHEDSLKPRPGGGPPRPATEPDGAEHSTRNHKTATDPATGEPNPARR